MHCLRRENTSASDSVRSMTFGRTSFRYNRMRRPFITAYVVYSLVVCLCGAIAADDVTISAFNHTGRGNMTAIDADSRVPDEQRLLRKLMTNYDHSVRPVYNITQSVTVNFSLTLVQIMDMDEKNQVLVTKVWLEHSWIDERIRWDPNDYNQLRIFRMPASKLWLPDIVLYNSADDFTVGYMPTNAMVHSNGLVFWAPPARLRSSCKVDITFFPFDQQSCLLKFGSWTYDQAQVDVVKSRDFVDMSNYITNGEWSFVGTRIVRNEVRYPIGPAVYPDVSVYVTMRRRILYYVLNIILPCLSLNLLSLLAFCLPPDAGEKVTLGITVLLSYSVFMLLVAENMPPTSEFVPLIGIYLTISMAVTSVSVVFTVWVLKLHHCGPHQAPMPTWLQRAIYCCGNPKRRKASANRRTSSIAPTTTGFLNRDGDKPSAPAFSISRKLQPVDNRNNRKTRQMQISSPCANCFRVEPDTAVATLSAESVEAFVEIVRQMSKAAAVATTESETGRRTATMPTGARCRHRVSQLPTPLPPPSLMPNSSSSTGKTVNPSPNRAGEVITKLTAAERLTTTFSGPEPGQQTIELSERQPMATNNHVGETDSLPENHRHHYCRRHRNDHLGTPPPKAVQDLDDSIVFRRRNITGSSSQRKLEEIGAVSGSDGQRPPQQTNCTITAAAAAALYRRMAMMEETLRYLATIMYRVESDDIDNDVVADWRQLAAIADRFLFWIFLAITVAYTGITMVLIPFYLQ